METQSLAQTLVSRLSARRKDIAGATTATKNNILSRFSALLSEHQENIISANQKDIAMATNLDAVLKERLLFNEKHLKASIAGIKTIIHAHDPIGEIKNWQKMPSGIQVGQMRIPLGGIFMIYESRPGVTADAAALALKSGNAIILRGGKEAKNTNAAIFSCLHQALLEHHLEETAQIILDPDRKIVDTLLRCQKGIDVVIPRGGHALIQNIMEKAVMPVIKHLDGNCHVYIDASAETSMAQNIVLNSKTRRYGVCNAAESILIHTQQLESTLPKIARDLIEAGVELRVCPRIAKALTKNAISSFLLAEEADWATEYLAPIISLFAVDTLQEAITHINHYGSSHTDAIVTTDLKAGMTFWREVDSSSVIINASTGFADGGEYGLGAEIGISTNKLHVRGPVGLHGLTTQKYIVLGDGECRT